MHYKPSEIAQFMGMLACLLLGSMKSYAQALDLKLSANSIAKGETVALEIDAKKSGLSADDFTVIFDGHRYPAMPHHNKKHNHFFALIPVAYDTEPGSYAIQLEAKSDDVPPLELPLKVTSGSYPSEVIQVLQSYVNLPKDVQQRVEEEWIFIQALYKALVMQDIDLETMSLPVDSKITSSFGTQRLFNGELKSYHNGVDLRAPTGTPIKAAQSGRVVLSKNLYYAGNHVIIDHGCGVQTTYSHLSEMYVNPGDEVKAGDVIGLSGNTGRVNGPHLHWGAKVNSVTVNPLQLKALLEDIVGGKAQSSGVKNG